MDVVLSTSHADPGTDSLQTQDDSLDVKPPGLELSWGEEPALQQTGEVIFSQTIKATKADDAEIPSHFWDERILVRGPLGRLSLEKFSFVVERLRKWLHRIWIRRVRTDFWGWWRWESSLRKVTGRDSHRPSLEAGLATLHHAELSSWWDWDQGSSPFFWRFPEEWIPDMRDGLKPRWLSAPPRYTRRQQLPSDPAVREKDKEKLNKVQKRRNITPLENIRSLTNFSTVPKGEQDIRMVYNGTKSGLNRALFAPWFLLATVDTMLRSVDVGTWSVDNNFVKMFLNFWLHPELRSYAGIYSSSLCSEELSKGDRGENALKRPRKTLWEAWNRCAMGLTTSPYQATQAAQRIKQLALGCRLDPQNVFRWHKVILNLPGDKTYNPSLAWVRRVCKDGTLVADVHPYVDDLRETAPTEQEAWKAASRMAKTAAYFGLQDAARKRRPPS
ncbi:hypothetical protein ACA910_018953 [Epithemia clementina (nom. ined.)]